MAEEHAELIASLRAAGRDVELPVATDPVATALARIRAAAPPAPRRARLAPPRATPRRRWVGVAAAVAVAVALAAVAAPGARQAVARFLGVGGVSVTMTGEPAGDLGPALDLGQPLPMDEAIERAAGAFAVRFPDPPGDPALALAGRPPGGVSLVWPASDDLPALDGADAGLVVTAFPAAGDRPRVDKQVGPGTRVVAVTVGSHAGYWVSGAPHEVHEVPPSGGDAHRARLAGNTLIWVDGATTYRLESALDREAAISIAERISPGGE